jgi:hypothetical protein
MAAAQVPARTINPTLIIPVRTVYRVLEQNLFNKYFQVQYTESIFQKAQPQVHGQVGHGRRQGPHPLHLGARQEAPDHRVHMLERPQEAW